MRHSPNAVPADKPLALVESGAHGLRITAVNSRAARDGVPIGTSLADARTVLPELLSRPAEPARDLRSLIKVARWLGRYGPARNRDGLDGAWVDITGVAHLFGGEDKLLIDLIGRLASFGITARAGLASTFAAAHALARFANTGTAFAIAGSGEDRDSLNAEHASPGTERFSFGAERAALATLPIEGLRLGPDTVVLLKRLGLRRIGQLYGVERAALERRFHADRAGKSKARHAGQHAEAVLMRLDQAVGLTPEPLRPLAALPSLSVRRTWGEPLISAEALAGEIAALTDDLCSSLKTQALGVRQICLTLFRADGTLAHVQAGFSGATNDAPHILRLLREKMSSIDAGFGIDMAVLDGHGAERPAAPQALLDTRIQAAQDGATALLIDTLSNRLGTKSLYTLEPHASHLPERAQRRMTASHPHLALPPAPSARRPAFLLAMPEPITVMAEVPEGIPKHFIWRRLRHRIVKGEGPERIAPEWWRGLGATAQDNRTAAAPSNTSASEPVNSQTAPVVSGDALSAAHIRDYYHLEDEAGARFWVFRAGLYQSASAEAPPRWFVHGLFA